MPDGVLRAFLKHYKSLPLLALMAALLTVLVMLVAQTALMQSLEEGSMDLRFRLSPQPALADTNIVIVAIDDASLKYVRQELHQGWPWPREYYALVTRFLDGEASRAIIFDINFEEPDLDRADTDSRLSDQAFAAALAQSQNSIIALTFTHYATAVDSLIPTLPFPEQFNPASVYKWQGALSPCPIFAQNAKMGGINLAAGKDATIRRVPLVYPYKQGYVPSLALQAFGTHSIQELLSQHAPDGTMYLNWHGAAGAQGVFKYIPFSQLLECALSESNGFEPPLPPGWFKDRHVFIGAMASGLEDLKSSPYTWATPGMEVWATQLSNLLGHNFIHFLPFWAKALLVFCLSLMMLALVMRLQGAAASGAALILILVFSLCSALLFGWQRIALNYSSALLVLLTSWLFGLTLSYSVEGRHKRELRRLFTRYLHPDLVQKIVDNPELVAVGGMEMHTTTLFSDIYDFTTTSEQYKDEPTLLVTYLNRYFDTLTGFILDHDGLLDKYTGDGLMAVFGAPMERDNHAILACKAALAHRQYCASFAQPSDADPVQSFHLKTRMGINSGIVVCGNVGSERRMDYTSIGDPVNLAARLEGINKVFHTHIIISQSTYEMVKELMLCRQLDLIRVKGKHEPTRIYELLGAVDSVDLADYAWLDDYQSALNLYFKADFEAAAQGFELLYRAPVCDAASGTMLERCRLLIKNPPDTWDGVFTMEEK